MQEGQRFRPIYKKFIYKMSYNWFVNKYITFVRRDAYETLSL